MAQLFAIHPTHPQARLVRRAAEIVRAGGLIAYPTDSCYALGCALDAAKPLERLRRARGIDERHHLTLVCRDLAEIARYAIVSDFAYRQMRRILPGPYTVVLDATREVPRLLLQRRRTIGIRVPASPVCEALVRALGSPLITTSAIPPGEARACVDVDEGKAAWPQGLDLVIDGGPTPGEPSTVLSLVGDEIEVLRQGLGAV